MEALGHFIFELFKIGFLSVLYTLILVLMIGIFKNNYPAAKAVQVWNKRRFTIAFIMYFSIYFVLFIYMFSYWGNHGFGDGARVPVGYGRAIEEINGTIAYLPKNGMNEYTIGKFVVDDKYIYGGAGDMNENYPNSNYFIYHLIPDSLSTFETETEFKAGLLKLKLNTNPDYKDFKYYYNEYWHGWRFWLLP